MAWHSYTMTGALAGSNYYRSLLTRLVAAATSKHVASAGDIVVNVGGSGYTNGDVLKITHASEPGVTADTAPLVFQVTVSGGAVTGVSRIISAGSFAGRVASATVSAGGSNYAVGDILEVQGGTFKNKAKFQVATLSGSAVATVTLVEDGGSYTAFPSNPASTVVVGPLASAGATPPSTSVGSGCTLTLTTQAEIGTTGISSTAVTPGGSGATFDLTLTAAQWTAVRNWNNYSVNSITNEKEVILLGTVAGGDAPYCGFRTYTQGTSPNIRYGWILIGMDDFNASLTMSSQANVGPGIAPAGDGVSNLLMFNAAESAGSYDGAGTYWFSVTGRRLLGVRKAQGGTTLTYQSFYIGLLNPFGTATENPYPFYISAGTAVSNTAPDAGGSTGTSVTGLTEVFVATLSPSSSPTFFRKPADGSWQVVMNAAANSSASTKAYVVYPLGEPQRPGTTAEDRVTAAATYQFYNGIAQVNSTSATILLMPSIGSNETLLVPATVVAAPTTNDNDTTAMLIGELDQVYWISATKSDGNLMSPEDTITISGQQYRVFPNAGRSFRYSFFAIKEA